jgi:chloride channel 7
MEETSSFWSHAITWRTLFSCIISAFVVDFMIAHSTSATSNAPDSLTHVAVFQVQGSTQATYFLWELVPFSILAVIGGLLGAAFIQLNSFATSYRIRMIGTRPLYRVLEVLFWVTLWTFMTHYSPYLVQCQQKPDVASQNWETGLLLEWTCDPNQYNGLASLLSISQTNALRSLLKQNALTDFTPGTLAVFMVIYFFGAALIAGSSLVSGLMVPFLVIGATYGRLMGLVIKSMSFGAAVEPGLYALIGATSFFGGVSRMTISLSVIILEITGNMALLLPIMLTAMISKWIGDLFSHSLYDILIHVQSIPFLESEPAPIFNILDVSQVMSRGVKQFTSIVSVREVIEMLTTHTHEGFPVVESKKHPRLRGLILRIQLLVLLDARIWQSPRPEIPFDEFQTRMMNFKQTIDQMEFEPEDLDCTFDLSPFYNQSPFSVHSGFLLTLAFRLFRTMGLRHLPVVDERNYVVGIITRKDLLDAVVEAKHDVLMRKHNLGTGFRKVLAEISERSSQQHRQDIVAPL